MCSAEWDGEIQKHTQAGTYFDNAYASGSIYLNLYTCMCILFGSWLVHYTDPKRTVQATNWQYTTARLACSSAVVVLDATVLMFVLRTTIIRVLLNTNAYVCHVIWISELGFTEIS